MSCPVAPQWVSGCLWEADWLAGPDEGHALLSSGNRWPHRVTSPHDQWRGRHCAPRTPIQLLINLLQGLESEPEGLILHYIVHIS